MSGHELDERVINFLQDVTGAMGLSLDVATEETADHVRLNLTGDRADIFLRKRGEALDALQAKGFINEARVVESVLHRRAARLGASRVRQELQAKGVADAAISDAMEHLRSTELARAREVWQKKFGTPPEDAAQRAKQIRFLLSRGFAAEAVRRVVAGADED